MLERIYKKPSLKKIQINSLFVAGGTIENLENFIKIDLITEYDKENNKMYFTPLFASVKNDIIQFVYDNKVICKKIVNSFEFFYKVQKTQIKTSNINEVLKSESFSKVFGGIVVKSYFNQQTF